MGMAAFCATQISSADDKVVVMVPAVLDPNAPISDAVKRECNVDTSVATQVFQRIGERYPGTEQVSKPDPLGTDKILLKVTLMSVVGHWGGGWSGPKAITIRADALRGSNVIATRTMNRQSGGGALGGMMGTCGIMDRIAAALGRDVAAWLPAALMVVRYDAGGSQRTQTKDESAALPAADKPAMD
ncbi:MAG: hypothetical protein ACREUO_03430, partial [Burkholderiales bacterium]